MLFPTGYLLLVRLYGPFLGHIGVINACWFLLPVLVYLTRALKLPPLGFDPYSSILHFPLGPIDARIEL
jgi:hypothetical protein